MSMCDYYNSDLTKTCDSICNDLISDFKKYWTLLIEWTSQSYDKIDPDRMISI